MSSAALSAERIHATLADDLMDMVMEDNPMAYSIWK
jgi:hypothetical protein